MFIAQICQIESISAVATTVKNDIDLQNTLGIESISASQLSRRLKAISSDFWETIFTQVSKQATRAVANLSPLPKADRIHIIDASTITLCLNSYLWADYRKTKAGVKLHQSIVYQDGYTYPEKAVLTTAKHSDISQLDELLVVDHNPLYAFDRGYVDYKKWDDYCEAGIRFVTRIKDNFIINILAEEPVANTDMTESIVLLGNPKTTIMHNKLRLIQTKDSKGNPVEIITNDFKLSAIEISETYRIRWQVELFFKWIKQHLKVKRFYGQSANAVYGQIWLALITYSLLLLTQVKTRTKKTLLDIQRLLKDTMFKPFTVFLEMLQRQPSKTSKGRQRKDYDLEFEQLSLQVESESSSFLDANDAELNYL